MEIVLSLIILGLLILGVVGFFRLKKQFSLEKLNIEEEQRRIIESAEIKSGNIDQGSPAGSEIPSFGDERQF